MGISFTLSTGLLNPWLLFLPTDTLGVMIGSRWLAATGGGLWGVLVVTSLAGVSAVLRGFPLVSVWAHSVRWVPASCRLLPCSHCLLYFINSAGKPG
nr:YhfT family protein [Vibrio anguillarum]